MTTNTQQQLRNLQSRTKDELKHILAEELGDAYTRPITNSLRNDFMVACCKQIEPDRDPFGIVQAHVNYSPSWSRKKQLATALRMLLTDRVDHPEHEGITSLNKQVLAELIVALRQESETAHKQAPDQIEESQQPTGTPDREPPAESRFDERFPAEKFDSYDLYTWLVERRAPDDGEHAVYVLDCTPPIEGEDDFRVDSLRETAAQKANSGEPLTKLEEAAQALTQGERLYYVGYASDVPQRIRQHVTGADSGGAKFTNMFVPRALVEVTWYQTETTARNRERRRAEELTVSGQSFGYAE